MAFAYKASITVDHTKVPNTNQAYFPVLISGTYDGTGSEPDLRSTGNGGKLRSDCYDVAFYSDSALTTRLPAEREAHSASTGAIVYWVQVPSVSYTADTVIYIAYGDAGVSSDPNSDATYGVEKVWSENGTQNFKGVWHLGDGSTISTTDATSNNYDATNSGVAAATGKVSGGGAWGSGDSFNVGDIDIASGSITISCWVYANSIGNSSNKEILSKPVNYLLRMATSTSGKLKFTYYQAVYDYQEYQTTDAVISATTWKHVALTFTYGTGSSLKIYVDGSLVGGSWIMGAGNAPNPLQGSDACNIGSYVGFESSNAWDGNLDEVRLAVTARAADWIATEYNNQSSPSTFYAMGAEGSTSTAQSTNLTGVQAATAIGSLTESVQIALTGAQSAGVLGSPSVIYGSLNTLTGVASSAATGTLTETIEMLLSGLSSAAQVGVLSVGGSTNVSLAGVQATTGTSISGVADLNLFAAGVQLTSSTGSASAIYGNQLSIAGQEAIASTGEVSITASPSIWNTNIAVSGVYTITQKGQLKFLGNVSSGRAANRIAVGNNNSFMKTRLLSSRHTRRIM